MSDETARSGGESTKASHHRTRLDRLDTRLSAVERSATGDDSSVADLSDAAELDARLTAVEETDAEFDERLSELEAAVQALRGYVGGVRAVNRDVERRADAAIAAVESMERERSSSDAVAEIVSEVDSDTSDDRGAKSTESSEPGPDDSGQGLTARLKETW
ncbi:hypothetical protein AUR64_08740 [Haloprofundus marisrubri]|uniref:DUF7310 domain-containing protein n=1 Tax=Haloprofundus marisrubri TaxID=1514971 RepID=A0A0W1R8J2_9EURY|nr:hypothetical protein [Haloprofundus marisrubri]KTG09718.1 hypothetical protein AUR64_08740 [Haloprofundus marisrubri]